MSFANHPRNWNRRFDPQVTGLPDNNHIANAAARNQLQDVSPIPLDAGGWAVAWSGCKWCVECFFLIC